jgi:DNA-binding MarR family transcriptional regulator
MPFLDSHSLRAAFCANLLERLAARIIEQGEELLRDAGIEFPSRAASTVLLLSEHGRMSAADIAKSLVQPHQLVTQRIDLLIELGVVARIDDPEDARRKMLSLTPKGRKQSQKLKARLVLAEAAFAALFKEIGCDLSAVALKGMDALDRSSILVRAKRLKAIA